MDLFTGKQEVRIYFNKLEDFPGFNSIEELKEDEKFRNKVEAKNKLEGMVYGMKTTLTEEKLKAAMPEDEMTKMNEFVTETLKYLEEDHTQEEYEAKQKELNEVFQPMKYMKPEGANGGVPGEMPMPQPKVEEVD